MYNTYLRVLGSLILLLFSPAQQRTPVAKPSRTPIRYMAGSKPYVRVSWSWAGLWKNHSFRSRTPRGGVSVRFLPNRDSKRPPAHDTEITHPYTDMPVVIRSPKALPVLVEIGDGPGYVPAAHIRVNGRAAAFEHGRVWLKGGRNDLLVTYPDAE